MGLTSQYTGGPRAVINLLGQIDRSRVNPLLITQRESEMTDDAKRFKIDVKICPLHPALECRNEAALKEPVIEKIKNVFRIREHNSQFKDLLVQHNCDGVWARNVRGVLLTGLAANKLGLPLIWDIGMEKPVKGLQKTVIFSKALRLSSKVVTQGPSVASQIFTNKLLQKNREKFTVIRTGVRPERIERLCEASKLHQPEGPFTIIFPATLTPRKNQMLLLRAAKELKQQSSDFQILLVGSATDKIYETSLREFVDVNALKDNVQFLGWREDVPELLAKSNAMVLCSLNEGVPQSILEAIHARVPVIGTRSGGIPDVIEDGRTGFLVDKSDERILADRILQLQTAPQLADVIADRAYRFVQENHTVEHWAKNTENLIETLVNPGNSSVTDSH